MAPQVNLDDLVITEAAWPYLVAQNGALDGLKGDRALWTAAYKQKLLELYQNLEPWLPPPSVDCVDIGGGMSGISILLDRYYNRGDYVGGRRDFEICVLDGDAPPEMHLHREPFSDNNVAAAFLKSNGVIDPWWIQPSRAVVRPGIEWGEDHSDAEMFNLVLSFGAWCFHLPPDAYLEWLLEATDIGQQPVRMILEVRREKAAWRSILGEYFTQVAVIAESKKWERIVYDRR